MASLAAVHVSAPVALSLCSGGKRCAGARSMAVMTIVQARCRAALFARAQLRACCSRHRRRGLVGCACRRAPGNLCVCPCALSQHSSRSRRPPQQRRAPPHPVRPVPARSLPPRLHSPPLPCPACFVPSAAHACIGAHPAVLSSAGRCRGRTAALGLCSAARRPPLARARRRPAGKPSAPAAAKAELRARGGGRRWRRGGVRGDPSGGARRRG
jgi:hypothetical protein